MREKSAVRRGKGGVRVAISGGRGWGGKGHRETEPNQLCIFWRSHFSSVRFGSVQGHRSVSFNMQTKRSRKEEKNSVHAQHKNKRTDKQTHKGQHEDARAGDVPCGCLSTLKPWMISRPLDCQTFLDVSHHQFGNKVLGFL